MAKTRTTARTQKVEQRLLELYLLYNPQRCGEYIFFMKQKSARAVVIRQ